LILAKLESASAICDSHRKIPTLAKIARVGHPANIARSLKIAPLIVWACLMGVSTMAEAEQVPEPVAPFTMEESAPVLRAFSKLGHVKVVNGNPFFRTIWPYVCWVDEPEFHTQTRLMLSLSDYPGKGLWALFQDQPRLCLMALPNSQRGESPFVLREGAREQFQPQVQARIKRLTDAGKPVPWRDEPFVSPEEFRAEKVLELAKLGSYIEEELGLQDKPSLGVEFFSESLELPLIEDRAGNPGSGIVLVADPMKYSVFGFSTSPFDRAIHFWITPEENRALYSEISAIAGVDTLWPLLLKVAEAKYGGLAILPEEIPQLAAETVDLAAKSKNSSVQDALEKLQSISRSAQHYHLGLYISGE
jgi:hypothetical protein